MMYVSANEQPVSLNLHRYSEEDRLEIARALVEAQLESNEAALEVGLPLFTTSLLCVKTRFN
jgi:hypothetical protein